MPAGDICALLPSHPLSLSLYYLHRAVILSPSTLRSNKKKGPRAWALIAASRCCSADRQERGRKEGEEEDRGRQKERRWDGVRESQRKRERVGGKESVLCLQLLGWLRGWRTECALCAFVCVCVYFPIQYVCCGLCAPVHAAIHVHELLNAFAWL